MWYGASTSTQNVAPRDFSMRGQITMTRERIYPKDAEAQWDRWRTEVGYELRKHAADQQEYDYATDFIKGKRLSPNGLRVLYRLEARANRSVLNTWKENG